MLNENIKTLRKARGLSQEELAIRLNVVRQTVSKWEQGLSVPDAGMVIQIAEALDTTVSVLLGSEVPQPEDSDFLKVLAAKLEVLTMEYSRQNEPRRKIWRVVLYAVLIISTASLLRYLLIFAASLQIRIMAASSAANVTVIHPSDADESASLLFWLSALTPFLFSALMAAVSVIGLRRTWKK